MMVEQYTTARVSLCKSKCGDNTTDGQSPAGNVAAKRASTLAENVLRLIAAVGHAAKMCARHVSECFQSAQT